MGLTFPEEYFQDEVRDGFLISKMMKRAWAAQLEVLEEIKRVCTELNIDYFADFGTLLGAVRHKGFIPWDDDLDICMLRADYNKFLEKAPKLIEDWYEIKSVYNDIDYDIVKARIINGRHINFDRAYLDKFHNCPYVVGIDIFPVDNVPDDENELNVLQDKLSLLLQMEATVNEDAPYPKEQTELMQGLEDKFGYKINYDNRYRHEIKKIYDIECAKYVDSDTNQVGCMMAIGARWDGFKYDRIVYENATEVPFENTTIKIPKQYHQILSSVYGPDYMTPMNVGASHDYPFYGEQIDGLKVEMEREFQMELSDDTMEQLIEMKILGA